MRLALAHPFPIIIGNRDRPLFRSPTFPFAAELFLGNRPASWGKMAQDAPPGDGTASSIKCGSVPASLPLHKPPPTLSRISQKFRPTLGGAELEFVHCPRFVATPRLLRSDRRFLRDDRRFPGGDRTFPGDHPRFSRDDPAFPHDDQRFSCDDRAFPHDDPRFPLANRAFPSVDTQFQSGATRNSISAPTRRSSSPLLSVPAK